MNKILFLNKNLGKSKLFSAFTLAEVLITIGIIGIVATIVIPVLISEYQKYTYVESLKKVYLTFDQALKQVSTDHGCINDLVCTGLFATGTDASSFGSEVVKYFKVVKNCGTGVGCWVGYNDYFDGTSGTINDTDSNTGYYKFITTNGITFAVKNYTQFGSPNCNSTVRSTGALGYMTNTCGEVIVDINSFKGPNYNGRDVFKFFITTGKGIMLYPNGGMDEFSGGNNWWNYNDANKCSSTSTGNAKSGRYCTGRIIEKGWVMDY